MNRTPYPKKLILQTPHGYRASLDGLVEEFLSDGVKFVAVVGPDCETVEDIIDELVVGNGDDPSRFLMTSSHPRDDLNSVLEFLASLEGEAFQGETRVLSLE